MAPKWPRKPRGVAYATGMAQDISTRRLMQASSQRLQFARHLRRDAEGALALKVSDIFFFNENDELDIRLSGSLQKVSNSPRSLTVDHTEAKDHANAVATKTASNAVRNPFAASSSTNFGLQGPHGDVVDASSNLRKRMVSIQSDTGLAALQVVGSAVALTATGAAANADDAFGSWISRTSGAVIGNVGGVITTTTITRRDWDFILTGYIQTGASIANVRIHHGLYSATPTGASSLAALSACGFRYATDVDGTVFWRTITSDAATETVFITNSPVAASTPYLLTIVGNKAAGWVRFYVNEIPVAEHSTTLPAVATPLKVGSQVTTLAAAAKVLSLNRLVLATN